MQRIPCVTFKHRVWGWGRVGNPSFTFSRACENDCPVRPTGPGTMLKKGSTQRLVDPGANFRFHVTLFNIMKAKRVIIPESEVSLKRSAFVVSSVLSVGPDNFRFVPKRVCFLTFWGPEMPKLVFKLSSTRLFSKSGPNFNHGNGHFGKNGLRRAAAELRYKC